MRLFLFCIAGCTGFLADAVTFSAIFALTNELLFSRVVAFWCALQVTWFCNKNMAFGENMLLHPIRQWFSYLLYAHVSGLMNLMAFMLVSSYYPIPIAFCIGILIGLCSNYLFCAHRVFRV